jgi:hypothetical protein
MKESLRTGLGNLLRALGTILGALGLAAFIFYVATHH